MRRIRYQVACSLDGYIAGPGGEFDWIVPDPEVDFEAMFAEFDTLLMGRRSYETVGSTGGAFPLERIVVVSRTLEPADHPDVTVISDDLERRVRELREEEGRDVWLFGGGELFSSLLELDLVDTVEPAIVPILLGGGVPFLPSASVRRRLRLTGRRVYEASGIVSLRYDVVV